MRRLLLLLALGLAAPAGPAAAEEVSVPHTAHVLPPLVPEGSAPLTPEKVELGKKLYFDTRLSLDDSVSCATCHEPRHGFAEPRPVSIGVGGKQGVRNAPSAFDAAFLGTQFWDGRSPDVEDQSQRPILNPLEMAMPDAERVIRTLN